MRNGFLDYLRLLAAAQIVRFHSHAPGNRIAYLAMPFFLVLLAYPSSVSFNRRAEKLLKPFVIWSGIYAVVATMVAVRDVYPPLSWVSPEMILTGTSIQLWFLPFAVLASLLKPIARRKWLSVTVPVLAAWLLALFPPALPAPWAQWSFGLVPVLIGLSYFSVGLVSLVPLTLCVTILAYFKPGPDVITIGVGTLFALLALRIHLLATHISTICAKLSLPMYLSHVIVIMAGMSAGLAGLGLGIFSVTGSLLLAMLIQILSRAGWRHYLL